MYKIQTITKDKELLDNIKECCQVLQIEFTALSELFFEKKNPHTPNRTLLVGSEYANQKLITCLMDTGGTFLIVAGIFDDGNPPFISKEYKATRKQGKKLSEKQFGRLFSECFKRWDEVFKPHGEENYGTNNRI